MRKLPDGRYHCFLSHSHQHGADQVSVIKYKIERMIEGAQCFLDVESNRLISSGSLSQLPAIINDSTTLLIFRKSTANVLKNRVDSKTVINKQENRVAIKSGLVCVFPGGAVYA